MTAGEDLWKNVFLIIMGFKKRLHVLRPDPGCTESALIYFQHAEHNVYQDEPERVLTAIRSFLSGHVLSEPE
jgi:pimeloyl-ACP methyl ester carboxylesterase